MKVIAVTQARLGSSRFPKKIFQTIKGMSLLEIHIRRIQKARNVDSLIIATTNKLSDDPIISKCNEWDVSFSRGSENDVLDRFYNALFPYKPDYVVRLTSDCPLIDPQLIMVLGTIEEILRLILQMGMVMVIKFFFYQSILTIL